MTTQTAASTEYAERRAQDWAAFAAAAGPPADHWAVWKQLSFDFRQGVEFAQPTGIDTPNLLEPLAPLLETLRGMEEIDLPPTEFLHYTTLRLGWLRPDDIYWTQVESFYVNAAPRLHRLHPFSVHFAGISARDDALYLGIDDGHTYREVRRQIRLGVPKAAEALRYDPAWSPEGDHYMPTLDFAFFTGRGDRRRVIEAVTPYLEADLGRQQVALIKMARIASDPQVHYQPIDVVAEIGLLGENARKGYHA
jgi:hypothetical protein